MVANLGTAHAAEKLLAWNASMLGAQLGQNDHVIEIKGSHLETAQEIGPWSPLTWRSKPVGLSNCSNGRIYS
jgi:hypothetical protein